MKIKVNTPTWGSVPSSSVEKVLVSVSDNMDSCFGDALSEDLWVHQNVNANPMVLPSRGKNGEYIIQLSATDCYWAQYCFQFAHEYCHVRTNFENTSQKFRWFEETICELASIFFLRRMSEIWRDKPPFPELESFAQNLFDYAQTRIEDPLHQLPKDIGLKEWFKGKISELEADQYIREYNSLMAIQILDLFENDSNLWRAMLYLNSWDTSADNDISEYLESYRNNVPEVYSDSVKSLYEVLLD